MRISSCLAPLLAGILASAAPARAAEPAAPGELEAGTKQFAAAIESFNALDPQSPDTLNARLAYANFLTRADSADCGARLNEAQGQIDSATANPAFAIALPAAWARAADLEYQLHLARAACGTDTALRDQELHAALEYAQRAVELYRDEFDAVSMVTMQFNVGVVYHNLGETAAAAAALQRTLDLDREYGFADDAKDNYRVLSQWNKEDAGPDRISAWMQDFPVRSASLSFGWFDCDARLTLQDDVAQISGPDMVHIQGSRSALRHVRRRPQSWLVSFELDDPRFQIDRLPAADLLSSSAANTLAQMLARFHDFRLDRKGDFDDSKGDFRFDSRARAAAKSWAAGLDSHDPDPKGGSSALWGRRIGRALKEHLLPDAIGARGAEDYNLETGTWIGATLEQGVWYDMTAALFVPLAPRAFLTHDIQFTYSRPVACLSDSKEPSCIEIVLRAIPDPDVLKGNLDAYSRARLGHGHVPRLWSSTTMRLVMDPATLWTYSRETRWHGYWSSGTPGPEESLIESEKTVESVSADGFPRAVNLR